MSGMICVPAGHEDDSSCDSYESSYENDFEDDVDFCWNNSGTRRWNENSNSTQIDNEACSISLGLEGSLMDDTFIWNKNSFARYRTRGSGDSRGTQVDGSNFHSILHSVNACAMAKSDSSVRGIELLLNMFKDRLVLPDQLINQLIDQWSQAVKPYDLILLLMEKSESLHYGHRAKFLSLILKSVETWKDNKLEALNKNSAKLPIPAPSNKEKLKALSFYVECPVSLDIVKLKNAFQLGDSDDKNDYEKHIKKLLDKHDYVKASRCISALGLQKKYACHEICLKLMCQGHIAELERFLDSHPESYVQFIKALDGFLTDEREIVKFYELHKIPRVKMYQLNLNSLFRLGLRLVRNHNLNESICPNIAFMQASKAIRFLIIKRFILNDIACKEWEELADVRNVAVSKNPKLQLFLVNELLDHFEEKEAIVMAAKYKVPENNLPKKIIEKVKTYLKENSSGAVVCPEVLFTMINTEDKYYRLSLPSSSVQWIDKKAQLTKAVEAIKKRSTFIGFDSEWRPTFTNIVQRSKLSLIQLATELNVYIVDVQTLLDVLKENEWKEFFTAIFCNPKILVVGYSLKEDLNMLERTLPFIKPLITNFNLFDLENIHHQLQERTFMIDGFIIDDKGLSDLVKRCLGKPLDKSLQISDWGRRPLRKPQLFYAALDVYCLIEIYKFLLNNNYHLIEKSLKNAKISITKSDLPKHKEESRISRRSQDLDLRNKYLIALTKKNKASAKQFKFLCDSTLTTFGRHLRMCGIDTRLLDEEEDDSQVAQISKNENRIILSSGIPFEFFANRVKSGMYYGVRGTNILEKLLDVFENFNIRIRNDDIFSRCQACNCDSYIVLSSIKMMTIWEKKRELLKLNLISEEMDQYDNIDLNRFPNYRNLKDDLKNREFRVTKILEDACVASVVSSSKIGFRQCTHSNSEDYGVDGEEAYEDVLPESDDILLRSEDSLKMVNLGNVTLVDGQVPIQCEWLSKDAFERAAQFFVCCCCGKVSWAEPFMERGSKFDFLYGKVK